MIKSIDLHFPNIYATFLNKTRIELQI